METVNNEIACLQFFLLWIFDLVLICLSFAFTLWHTRSPDCPVWTITAGLSNVNFSDSLWPNQLLRDSTTLPNCSPWDWSWWARKEWLCYSRPLSEWFLSPSKPGGGAPCLRGISMFREHRKVLEGIHWKQSDAVCRPAATLLTAVS